MHTIIKFWTHKSEKEPCNCQRRMICPMDRIAGGCQAQEVIYQVDVSSESNPTMTYYGQTMRPFKKRWIEHKNAIANENSPHATALSNYIWKLKHEKKTFEVKCSIKDRASMYKSGSKHCMLCLKEKLCISLHKPKTLLNAKSEIMHKCIHRTRYEWMNVTKSKKKKDNDHNPPWTGGLQRGFFFQHQNHCAPSCAKKTTTNEYQCFSVILNHLLSDDGCGSIMKRLVTAKWNKSSDYNKFIYIMADIDFIKEWLWLKDLRCSSIN